MAADLEKASEKVSLTKELWNKLSGNDYGDFDNNKVMREQVRAYIFEYYKRVAAASGGKAIDDLRADDFKEIIAFFKEKLVAAPDDSKCVIAKLIYFETWYADEGWLRQDWSLGKLFLAQSKNFFKDSEVDREAFAIDVFRMALMPEESALSLGKLVVMAQYHYLFKSSEEGDLNRLQEIFINSSMLNEGGCLAFTFGLNVSQDSKVRTFVEKELAPKLKEAVRNSQFKKEGMSSHITVADIEKGAAQQNFSGPQKNGSNIQEESEDQSFRTPRNTSLPHTANQKNKVEKSNGGGSIRVTIGGLAILGVGIALFLVPGLQVLGIGCIVVGVSITVTGVVYPDSKAKVEGDTAAQHNVEKSEGAGKEDGVNNSGVSNELRHVASGSPKKGGSVVVEKKDQPQPGISGASFLGNNSKILENGLGAGCCVFQASSSDGGYPNEQPSSTLRP